MTQAIEQARERLRVLMLEQSTTGTRSTYSDGFAQGLSHAIHEIDRALKETTVMTIIGIHDEIVTNITQRLAAETEAWCAGAIRRGPGWRVWRSEPIFSNSLEHHAVTHQFKMLAPDEPPPPGFGVVYGPWPERDFP